MRYLDGAHASKKYLKVQQGPAVKLIFKSDLCCCARTPRATYGHATTARSPTRSQNTALVDTTTPDALLPATTPSGNPTPVATSR